MKTKERYDLIRYHLNNVNIGSKTHLIDYIIFIGV
jgi:hypothetical protein